MHITEARVSKRERGTADPSPPDAEPLAKRYAAMRMIAPNLTAALIVGRQPPPPMPDAVAEQRATTRKERQRLIRKARAAQERQRRQDATTARDAEDERRGEGVSPSAQRKPVTAPDGTILRAARLIPDGVTFRVSNPIAHMAATGERRSNVGLTPTVDQRHVKAAERWRRAWEDGGREVGFAIASYGERIGGTPQSGVMAERIRASVGYQNRMRDEFLAAAGALGPLFPCLRAIVLDGMDAKAWAAREKRDVEPARGFVAAGLELLVAFYGRLDQAKRAPESGKPGIRSAVVARRETVSS